MSGPFRPRGEEPPEPEQRPDPPPERRQRVGGMGSNTTWIVGVLAVVFLAYVTYNSITTESQGSLGIPAGEDLPPFAGPLALANLKCENEDGELQDCDAEVNPDKVCGVDREGAVNSCALTRKGPVVVAFLAEPSGECVEQIDLLDRIARRYEDVSFVAVAIRGDHEEVNDLIREQGWEIPVVYDNDGAIANAFGIAVCPTITFARQGGEVEHTQVRATGAATILRHLNAIR